MAVSGAVSRRDFLNLRRSARLVGAVAVAIFLLRNPLDARSQGRCGAFAHKTSGKPRSISRKSAADILTSKKAQAHAQAEDLKKHARGKPHPTYCPAG